MSTDRAHAVDFTSNLNNGLLIEPSQPYQIMWDKNMLLPDEDPSNYTVCITWYRLGSNCSHDEVVSECLPDEIVLEWLPCKIIGHHCGVAILNLNLVLGTALKPVL